MKENRVGIGKVRMSFVYISYITIQNCVLSGSKSDADEMRALLGYYATKRWQFFTDVSGKASV